MPEEPCGGIPLLMTDSLAPVLCDAKEERYYRAVIECDPSFDGTFFYSVVTTGVFCRPSCRSRSPKRENLRFHRTAFDAERAGYRACKRCRPEEATRADPIHQVTAVCRLIERSPGSSSITDIARSVRLSPSQLHRIFKEYTLVTPGNYRAELRRQNVQKQLPFSRSVTEAIHASGYGSSGRFYESGTALLGMTASAYRKRGEGETIRFAVADCSLGVVLVAASGIGVCAILIGDEPASLLEDLASRFHRADIEAGDERFDEWIACVVGLIDQPSQAVHLPLDIRGTLFQQRVWAALREIPPGKTLTYAEIARQIGDPKAARAVASACAKNPLAVAVPCHRVVRQDGGLAGFRWGIERKRMLLERERSG